MTNAINFDDLYSGILEMDDQGVCYLHALIFSSWMAESGESIKEVFSTLAFSLHNRDLALIRTFYNKDSFYGFAFLTRPASDISAVRINYIAVNPLYKGNGIGTMMLDDIKSRFDIINLVSSYGSAGFYKKNDFFDGGPSNDGKRIMFFSKKNKNTKKLNRLEFAVCALSKEQTNADWHRIKKAFLIDFQKNIGNKSFEQFTRDNGINVELIEKTI
ncbi:GNAT family N-acetyltransferase [Aeromonas dhakensis]|uniref:GNAT family N-acetyltransferase n=1 Tax=Aeromonas dhakensis TaxID=196024 RepID=UPI002447C19A|nr:GNAT family N-acetyltransferase [Aeromonas dhakensis]MDH0177469.1 GNAT family N-acetyltransferase [Aeromonas dhakensis]